MAGERLGAFLTRAVGSGFRKGRWYRVWVMEDAIYFADIAGQPANGAGTVMLAFLSPVGAIAKAAITSAQAARFGDQARKQAEALGPDDLVLDGKDTFRTTREEYEWSGTRITNGGRVIEWMVQLREQGRIRFQFPTQADWEEARPWLRAWFTADFDNGVTWDDDQKKFVPA